MRKTIIILFLALIYNSVYGQVTRELIPGQVSFISSQNIYVKFKSTSGISVGDTLFISSGNKLIPALKVDNLSTVSCVCTSVSDIGFSLSDLIFAKVNISKIEKSVPDKTPEEIKRVEAKDTILSAVKQASEYKETIRGSISAYSYSDFSNTAGTNSQRFRYTLSLNAKNISGTRFSFDNYLSFRHKAGDWGEVKSNVFNALKIYSLSVKYDINKTSWLSLGRNINPSISSIGAMDGLQFQKSLGNISVGAVAGTRPDFINYGFDSKLFQYGAWLGFNTKSGIHFSESSLAFMQQMNSGKTDRRFLYLQHSNSLIKNIDLFGTLEIDLYELITDPLNNQTSKSTFNPTGVYLSLRYRASNSLSFSGSYDARKNVIYYETYKTFLDRILETEMRQGFRLQANYRITKDIMFGIQSGYRFLKSDPHPSKNIYSYVTYSQIPGVKMTATVSATYIESNYMNGTLFGGNLSKDLFNNKVQTGVGYRFVDYSLPENKLNLIQHIAEASISWQIYDKLSFAFSYEGTFEKADKYNRFYLQLRKRF
jgi:hypothetical protein